MTWGLLRERRHDMQWIAGVAAMVGAALFSLSLVILHVASRDIDWPLHYVSDFATGPFGSIFAGAVLVHGAGNLALGLGLRTSLNPSPIRTWAVGLFSMAAAGIVAAALFPINPSGLSQTPTAFAHRAVVSASFPAELAALFLFSAAFGRHPRWRRHSGTSFSMSVTSAVAFAGLLVAVLVDRLPGVAERLSLASFMAWELWAAFQLTRQAASSHRTPVSGTRVRRFRSGADRSRDSSAEMRETRSASFMSLVVEARLVESYDAPQIPTNT
jgi:hypothetical protein